MMKPDELYDAFEAEEQNGWDRRRAVFLKAAAHARNDGLEEAAKVVETLPDIDRLGSGDRDEPPVRSEYASAIRALITTTRGNRG